MVNHLQTFQVSRKLLRFAMACSGILPSNVQRVIYLDSDLAVVDDIWKLWWAGMEEKVVAAVPEYCHANFTQYFTGRFWSDTELARQFQGRNPCYFNTGVLGGDKFEGKCRNLHPGPIRLLQYWSGKGKPRLRLDSGKPCIVDHLWAPYDLYSSSTLHPLEE